MYIKKEEDVKNVFRNKVETKSKLPDEVATNIFFKLPRRIVEAIVSPLHEILHSSLLNMNKGHNKMSIYKLRDVNDILFWNSKLNCELK